MTKVKLEIKIGGSKVISNSTNCSNIREVRIFINDGLDKHRRLLDMEDTEMNIDIDKMDLDIKNKAQKEELKEEIKMFNLPNSVGTENKKHITKKKNRKAIKKW